MTALRRINVGSGRPLESKAHYSRALRVGSRVLQSGTTAIDRDGNVVGESVAEQVMAVLDICEQSMTAAEGRFDDVVRARLFVRGDKNLAPAIEAFNDRFKAARPALTVIPISALARPAQLIEIELEARDGAAGSARIVAPRAEDARVPAGPAALRVGRAILLGGVTAGGPDAGQNVANAIAQVLATIEQCGGAAADLVALRVGSVGLADPHVLAATCSEACGEARPAWSLLGVPAFGDPAQQFVIEAEAIAGCARSRHDHPHVIYDGFSQAVEIDGEIFLSNILPLRADGGVEAAGDWGGQRDRAIMTLESTLEAIDASLDDVVNRRYYTRADAEINRDYGDGTPWFASTRPAALGCRIESHADPQVMFSVEAHAMRGAGASIEWRTLGDGS